MSDITEVKTLAETLEDAERQYLVLVLSNTRGDVRAASRIAGVHRTQFYRRMQRRGVQPTRRNTGNDEWKELGHHETRDT